MRTLVNLIMIALIVWGAVRLFAVGGDPTSLETYKEVVSTMVSDFRQFLDLIQLAVGKAG